MDNNNPSTDEVKREKVREVPVKFIDDFPDHPFQVKDDESMELLIRSIDMNGVLNPVIEDIKVPIHLRVTLTIK